MTKKQWVPPADLDKECLSLCVALNKMPGIRTTESCCGHGQQPYRIFFQPDNLESLPELLYWLDKCHSGKPGWQVRVYTDCVGEQAFFVIEGPAGAHGACDAEAIAILLEQAGAFREN